mmetsp:Transcript_27054/g.56004  ORF Transcript_27054/g.56004 Transcript_27054/m.56004 type:complete len:859 (+) Transcript_27054:97-2673(+)
MSTSNISEASCADAERPKKRKEVEASVEHTIRNPLIRCIFEIMVDMPCSTLIILIVFFFVTANYGGKPYKLQKEKAEKDGESAILMREALQDDVTTALVGNFVHNVMIPPQVTEVVMWADAGKKITDIAGVQGLKANLQKNMTAALSDHRCVLLKPIAGLMMPSPDGSAISMPVMQTGFEGGKGGECEVAIGECIKDFNGQVDGVKVALGTPAAATLGSLNAALDQLQHHLKILTPVMFILLILITGSIPRAITPFITIAVSTSFSCFVAYIVRKAWPRFNIGGPDSMVTFILLGLGIDYALFFWTRFSQERRKNPEKSEYNAAIMKTLETSGCVIFISVLALVAVYVGLSFYPYMNATGDIKSHIQLIAGITMLGFTSMAWPAALAAQFPSMFDEPKGDEVYCCSIKCETLGRVLNSISPMTFYFNRCSAWITRSPWKYVMPVLILGGFIPFLVVLSQRAVNYDMEAGVMSAKLLEYQAMDVVKTRFQVAKLTPTPILLEATPISGSSPVFSASSLDVTSMLQVLLGHSSIEVSKADSIALSPGFGTLACKFAKSLLANTRGTDYEIGPGDIDGIWWNATAGDCIDAHSMPEASPTNPVSTDGLAQVMMVYPHYSKMGKESQKLTRTLWDVEPQSDGIFEVDGQRYHFRARHASVVSTVMKMEEAYRKAAPYILVITAAVVCILFGVLFHSVGITFKVMLTVILPLCGTYGLTVGAFQYGWFEAIGVMRVEGGLFWTLYYTGMCFLFALAVDYDMFLFARVYEYRHMGYDNDSCVEMALKETGPVITTAGTIMMISFFTLCLTDQFLIQQLSFLYFVGVALDTYIVRPFVAPAALCVSETLNYWPGKVPPVTKSLKD